MKCPSDNVALVMSERNGIEIDYCPECRGVWLDRGELDKIIDRAGAMTSPAPAAPAPSYTAPPQQYSPPPQQGYSQPAQGYGQAPQGHGQQPYYRKKKENWLSELFD